METETASRGLKSLQLRCKPTSLSTSICRQQDRHPGLAGRESECQENPDLLTIAFPLDFHQNVPFFFFPFVSPSCLKHENSPIASSAAGEENSNICLRPLFLESSASCSQKEIPIRLSVLADKPQKAGVGVLPQGTLDTGKCQLDFCTVLIYR